MRVPVEEWEAVLFHTTIQVDVFMIQYIITEIQSITFLKYKSQLDSLSTKLPTDEQMFH